MKNLKLLPDRSCNFCRLNKSVYCRECYDFSLYAGSQQALEDFFDFKQAVKACTPLAANLIKRALKSKGVKCGVCADIGRGSCASRDPSAEICLKFVGSIGQWVLV